MKTYNVVISNKGQDDLKLKMTEDDILEIRKDAISINPLDGSMKMPRGETISVVE